MVGLGCCIVGSAGGRTLSAAAVGAGEGFRPWKDAAAKAFMYRSCCCSFERLSGAVNGESWRCSLFVADVLPDWDNKACNIA